MKSFISILIATFAIITLKAQFANTSWKGLYKVPDPTEMILQFKTDTLLLIDPMNNQPVETMKYSVSGDTVTITKISGASDCNDEKGIYKMEIKDNKLFITLISDDCYSRSASGADEALEKIED
jgi:hypothetical protein